MAVIPDLTFEQKLKIATYTNRLDEVKWDRYTAYADDGRIVVSLYGWIPRADGRSDFVLLQWFDLENDPVPYSSTSSAARSTEISRRLYEDQDWFKPSDHVDCQRVDENFGDLIGNAAHAE